MNGCIGLIIPILEPIMKPFLTSVFILILFFLFAVNSTAQVSALKAKVDEKAATIEAKAIEWRHHLHENPELSNREYKTAAYVEKHLRELGLEVRTGIAHTGLIGILRGGKPGPVVALRADMDALP